MGVLEEGFFAEADSNNDGFVSKSEYVAFCYQRKGASPDADDWKKFYAADANGDGQISRGEFERYVEGSWSGGGGRGGGKRLSLDTINVEAVEPVPEPAYELGMLEVGFFDAADTDGDGFVSKAEFSAYRLKQCGAAPSPNDWKAFFAADRNGDGQMSRQEFDSFVASQWAGGSGATLQLDADDRVTVHSLVAAGAHNGKNGVVVAFNPDNGRYAVRLDDGSALSIRPGNLVLEGAAIDIDVPTTDSDDSAGQKDLELEHARSELARLAEFRKQEAASAQSASEAAQVAELERQRNARVQAEARAQLAKSRTQKKEEALAAAKAQLAQLQGGRGAGPAEAEAEAEEDSPFTRTTKQADQAAARLGVADQFQYARSSIQQLSKTGERAAEAHGRRWTESEVLQLEAEVAALRRSILAGPLTAGPASSDAESARIDRLLTSHLGPRDQRFERDEVTEMLTAALGPRDSRFGDGGTGARPAAGGRVGLSPEWLAQQQKQQALAAVRSEVAKLKAELGQGTLT